MESNSLPGRVNVSENTYELIRDQFACEYRGEVQVKNRGYMKMYFVIDPAANNPIKDKSVETEASL
jgi:class 3 adenylate cyclase